MAGHLSPRIVANNLLLSLDAGNNKSYRGTGTLLQDLSGNNYSATLSGGPTYVSSNLGKFTLDGIDDFISMNGSLLYPTSWSDNFTFEVWIYVPTGAAWSPPVTGYPNGVTGTIIGKGSYGGSMGLVRASNVGSNGNSLGIFLRGTSAIVYAGTDITRDAWYQVLGTWNGSVASIYTNGQFRSSSTGSPGGSPFSGPLDFGGARAFGGNLGSTYAGQVSIIRMYDRSLTSNEVLQNFETTKGRFGL